MTTKGFLEHFGLDPLRNLPELEALKDAGPFVGHDDDSHAVPIDPTAMVDHSGHDKGDFDG